MFRVGLVSVRAQSGVGSTVSLRSVLIRFQVGSGLVQVRSEVGLGMVWDRFGVGLVSACNRSVVCLGLVSDWILTRWSTVSLGVVWDRFGVCLVSFRAQQKHALPTIRGAPVRHPNNLPAFHTVINPTCRISPPKLHVVAVFEVRLSLASLDGVLQAFTRVGPVI